jgi:hypothetical protein
MRRFVEGTDRGQSTLFPECLGDWISEDNPVRVIDVFVDEGALSADQFLTTNFSKVIHSLHSPKREANLPMQNNRTSTEGSSIFGAKTLPAFTLPI